MSHFKFRRALLVLVVPMLSLTLSVLPSTVFANPLFTFGVGEPTGGEAANPGGFTIGFEFVPTQQAQVTGIGAWVDLNIAAGVTTADFTALLFAQDPSTLAWSLLDKVLIPTGTAADSSTFAYVPLSTTLNAGTHYVIADYMGTPTSATAGPTPYAADAAEGSPGTLFGATFVENRYIFGSAPDSFPSNTNSDYMGEFLGGNLQVSQVVPEPSSVVLGGLAGLFALGFGLRTVARRRA